MCVCSNYLFLGTQYGRAELSLSGWFIIELLEHRWRAPVRRIEDITCGAPAPEAAVAAAPRTECALNMAVSMPAFSSKVFSQRAIVELEAGEWGLMVVRKRGFESVSFLNC